MNSQKIMKFSKNNEIPEKAEILKILKFQKIMKFSKNNEILKIMNFQNNEFPKIMNFRKILKFYVLKKI